MVKPTVPGPAEGSKPSTTCSLTSAYAEAVADGAGRLGGGVHIHLGSSGVSFGFD